MQNHVDNDPVARHFTDEGRMKGHLEGRMFGWQFYECTTLLKAQLRDQVPRDFLNWLACRATEENLRSLESVMEPNLTFKELVDRSGVNWNDSETYTYD